MRNLKLLLLLTFVFLRSSVFCQGLFTGDKKQLDRDITFRKIPSINVLDKAGNRHELDKYIEANKQHADKPYLLVLWGAGEQAGFESLNEMAAKKIADQYNIIALFISSKLTDAETMNKQLKKAAVGSNWDNFLVLSTSFDEIEKGMYLNIYPAQIYANSVMQNITVTYVQPYSSAKIMLDNLQAGLKKGDKVWYTEKDNFANSTDDSASYYKQYILTEGYANVRSGTKNTILSNIRYHIKGNNFLYEGNLLTQTETGQLTAIGNFTDGIPIDTFKTFYENGKPRSIYPPNGIYRVYDETGKVIFEGAITNGLGNGIFTQYAEGKKVGIYYFKTGIPSGLQQQFNADGTKSEWFASSEYEFGGYLTEGLQKIRKDKLTGYADRTGKIIIPVQYDYGEDFKDGKAKVSLNMTDFNIDKKGTLVKD